MSFINRVNNVPRLQRLYQAAYRQHTRIWNINPRSRYILTPYLVVLWTTSGLATYAVTRKALGYNSWFESK